MTNPKIPEWVQAAIAKLNEKCAEKRQKFEDYGYPYHDGFADGLDAAETIFMREFENSAPKENDIAEIELHSSHIITLLQSLVHMLHNLAKENETSSDLFKDTFEIFDFFVNDLDIEKSKYVQENQAANQFIADMKQVAHEIKNQPMEWERLTFTASELLEMLKEDELQSGWISVADRLPENGEIVALYDGFTLVKAEFNAADGEDIVTPFFELHDTNNTFNQICDDCINYGRTIIYPHEIPKFLWQPLPPPPTK